MEPIFSALLFLGTFAMSQLHLTQAHQVSPSVQGASTTSLPSRLPSSSPLLSPTPTQTILRKVVLLSQTPQKREVGAWYWKKEIGRSQRWLGLGKDGKDIWTDSGDPTPTPTPKPEEHNESFRSSSSTQVGVQSSQESIGTSSIGTVVSAQNQKVSERK